MFNSCFTCLSSRSTPRSEANAFCTENKNADAIIPTHKAKVRAFMSTLSVGGNTFPPEKLRQDAEEQRAMRKELSMGCSENLAAVTARNAHEDRCGPAHDKFIGPRSQPSWKAKRGSVTVEK